MTHTVTVIEHADGPKVVFECSAGADAKCRTYRDGEDSWDGPEVHHERCWIATWFDVTEYCSYTGDDAEEDADGYSIPPNAARTGEISTLWCEDYIEWHFLESADPETGEQR